VQLLVKPQFRIAFAGKEAYAVIAAFDSVGDLAMATLTVRNLDPDVIRRLRIRAAEHGRSAEAEHREILRLVLIGDEAQHAEQRQRVAERLAEFRRRTGGRGSPSAAQLLEEARAKRTRTLAGLDKAG
jgi:antitoxin FitA